MEPQSPSEYPNVPLSLVPTPTKEYRTHRKTMQTTIEPGMPTLRIPVPFPIPIPRPPLVRGARVLIWKQDPSVGEIGIRKAYLPKPVLAGPRDGRILNGSPGIPAVNPNAFGDLVQSPGTDAFDAVHCFAVVRMTLTLVERSLFPAPVPWAWNSTSNSDPVNVFPHGLPNTMNAFYTRSGKALKFGDFIRPGSTPPERVFTCRSFDIVAHETGHAVLDGLKPGWLSFGNPPQTGGLHESFGDLMAIFLALSQLDQVEAVIAQTKGNLHDKTFLSDLAEQFGLALGRPNGLRNADNNLKLSQVGNEVHAISQVFTGAIYDILADIFAFERNPARKDDAAVLYDVAQYLLKLVLRALKAAPATASTYPQVANQMLNLAAADGKPVAYRNFIRNRFTVREVVVSPTPLTEDHEEGMELAAMVEDHPEVGQDRRTCCGTMQSPEFTGSMEEIEDEIDEFMRALGNGHRNKKTPKK